MPVTPSRPAETAAQPASLDGFVPFPPERAARYSAAGYWAGRSIDSVLAHAATAWPESVAVVDDLDSYTYSELDELVDRAAAGFATLGIAPADRVLLQLPNSCRFVVALFGLLRAGAIPVMCLPGHRLAELSHFAPVSEAVGLVITDAPRRRAVSTTGRWPSSWSPSIRSCATSSSTAIRGLSCPGRELPDGDVPRIAADTALPAVLLVSGGTTGAPKLIPRTHDDYVYNATASAELCRLTHADVYLVMLPAAHNFPLACPGILGAMTVGATIVFSTDPSPEAAFATIDAARRHRHRAGAGAGQTVGASLRLGAGDTKNAAALASRWCQAGARGCPQDTRRADPGPAAGIRNGRRTAELHPARRSAGINRAHPGSAPLRGRRTAHRRWRG